MYRSIAESVKRGIQKIRDNPQLIFTLFVAVVIFLSFLFLTQRFVSIAQDAQDRLINVRIGSLQDAFVELIRDDLQDSVTLHEKIQAIARHNETIHEFKIVDLSSAERNVIASLDPTETGLQEQEDNSVLYQLAQTDPTNSYTVAVVENDNRYFKTVRAITDDAGKPIAVVLTKESLSQADQTIDESIRNSIIIFACLITLIMLLFFRHSRIIDYSMLYSKLKEVDALKDDFIAMASHELRTPLSVIRWYADYIRKADGLTEDTRKYAQEIDIASERLNLLISDMLDVSRIEQGRLSFELKAQDPHPIITHVVDSFKLQAEQKKLALSYTGVSSTLLIDEQRFNQVLINIIGNAIKYTKEGSVTVKSSIEYDKYHIRVSDTGIGLTADEQKVLFKKFSRVKSEDTKEISGTGLGLWITQQIVEKMSGTIEVESIKGKGTDFIVSFPVQKSALPINT